MSFINSLPPETLQNVATYLSTNDCLNVLLVCRSWYQIFQGSMFKNIHIFTTAQLKKLLELLSTYGPLVKELHLLTPEVHDNTSYSINNHYLPYIQLSQEDLLTLNRLCPLLEVFVFDPSRWHRINLENFPIQWKEMKYCGIVQDCFFNASFFHAFGSSMTRLHLSGDQWDVEGLVERLRYLPKLQYLTIGLEMNRDINEQRISKASRHLEKMHGYLPELKEFNFKVCGDDGFYNIRLDIDEEVPVPFSQPAVSVLSLTCTLGLNSSQSLPFLAKNYPRLQELNISGILIQPEEENQVRTKVEFESGFIELLKVLPLVKLSLKGPSIFLLLTEEILESLRTSSIKSITINVDKFEQIKSTRVLKLLGSHRIKQLKHLSLSANVNDTKLWPGVTENLFNYHGLTSLDLWYSVRYTSFCIDTLLENMPNLKSLSLSNANIQVANPYSKDLNLKICRLESLLTQHCNSDGEQGVFEFLSAYCPKLNQVMLREYKEEARLSTKSNILTEWSIDLKYSRLEKIVLPTAVIHVGPKYIPEFIGVQINDEYGKKMIWCKKISGVCYVISTSITKNITLDKKYESYKLSPDQDIIPGTYMPILGVLTIHCKSVDQVLLNNLEIKRK